MATADAIIDFWFGEDLWTHRDEWWRSSDAFDHEIASRFGDDVTRALEGAYAAWAQTPRGRLALILLLDQFTRNIFRGSARAFEGDARALKLSRSGVEAGMDQKLQPMHRAFFYMPLEHAEDPAMQEMSVDCFRALAASVPDEKRSAFDVFVDFAERHKVVIDRFGRYPHRNAVLGRSSTPEEEAFLAGPGAPF